MNFSRSISVEAGQIQEATFTVDTVEEDENGEAQIVQTEQPGYWVYLAINAYGQRLEIKGAVNRQFLPLPKTEAAQLKSNGHWTVVRGRDFRRSLAMLREEHFVENNGALRLNQADDDALEAARVVAENAVHAAIYHNEETEVTSLRAEVPEEAEKLGELSYIDDDGEKQQAHLCHETKRRDPRPAMDMLGVDAIRLGDGIQNLSQDERRILLSNLLSAYDDQNMWIVGDRDDTIFVAPKSRAEKILSAMDVLEGEGKYSLLDNAHVLRRTGVIIGRTGGFSVPVPVGEDHLPEEMDGTIIVSEDIELFGQGTPMAYDGEDFYAGKGTVRPPIVHDGTREQTGVGEGALGRDLTEVDEMDFYLIDRVTESSARLNTQALSFSTEDGGARAFDTWAKRAEDFGVEDIMSERAKQLVENGVPAGLVVDDRDITDNAHKMDVPGGYRAKVAGIGYGEDGGKLIGDDEILLPPAAIRQIEEKLGRELEVGETLFVLRDPALPDGSGIQEFTFAGELQFAGSGDAYHGVGISAFSEQWLSMGGDFDGDAAVVAHPELACVSDLKDHTEVEVNTDAVRAGGFAEVPGSELSLSRAYLSRLDKWSSYIGIAASMGQRAWAMSAGLFENIRGEVAELVQGSIDAKKHRVDQDYLGGLDDHISETVHDALDDAEYDIIGLLSDHKNATGEEKTKAWSELVDVAREVKSKVTGGEDVAISDAALALLGHVLTLEKKRQGLDGYRSSREDAEWPDELRQRGHDILADDPEVSTFAEQKHITRAKRAYKKWAQYTSRQIQAREAGRKEEAQLWSEKAEYVADAASLAASRGMIHPAAFVAAEDMSAYFRLEVIEPEHLEMEIEEEQETGAVTLTA
jgi:hypothetical protein